jgi:hypothetical protein
VNGKTGTRPIPLIDSIPYLKDYLEHDHPMSGNPNAPLICGLRKGLGRHMSPIQIFKIYAGFKKQTFPKLLESPAVLPEDKQRIKELLMKPWNPYIRRHSALTEKARFLKEPILKMHGGWSRNTQMHLKYEHWFGNESNASILEAYGLIDKSIHLDLLRPKVCTNCGEPNKAAARFCAKCRMILSYDGYNESLERQKEENMTQATVNQLSEEVFMLRQQVEELISRYSHYEQDEGTAPTNGVET